MNIIQKPTFFCTLLLQNQRRSVCIEFQPKQTKSMKLKLRLTKVKELPQLANCFNYQCTNNLCHKHCDRACLFNGTTRA